MTDKKKPGSKGDYDVGYGKPPKRHRFKKGQSGNRAGRPKGATNRVTEESVLTIVAREAYREVAVNDGIKIVKLPVITVTIRSLMQKGAKGDVRAALKACELLQIAEEKGASDKAMAAKKANQSFEEFLDTLSLEEITEFHKNMDKATNIRKFSQAAIRQAQLAEQRRLAALNQ